MISDELFISTALEVAERFGKLHKNIIQSIEKLVATGKFGRLNFQPSSCRNSQNKRQSPMHLMDRHGFSVLVMGFSGDAALDWKIRYDRAFERMVLERMNQQIATSSYIPGYHSLHKTVDQQAVIAQKQGSKLTRELAHSNINQMLNSLFGLSAGQRNRLTATVTVHSPPWHCPSSPRKRGSMPGGHWIPAFAGMTIKWGG